MATALWQGLRGFSLSSSSSTSRFIARHFGTSTDSFLPALSSSLSNSNSNSQNTSFLSPSDSTNTPSLQSFSSVGNSHVMTTRRLRKLSFLCGDSKQLNPFSLRFQGTRKSFFPIISKNLRESAPRKKRCCKRGRGKSGRRGTHKIHYMHGDHRPDLRMWEGGGNTPLYKKIPRWKELKKARSGCRLSQLSLARLRYFIEKGRLDTRYPITQRHLLESGCVKQVHRGVKLYNYNDYPFPYKIDIELASCDQSTVDMIRRVGGSITIVYYDRIGLKAHLQPWKFDILPQNARPRMPRVQFMEKMRARGCLVRYIKPIWLIREEQRIKTELREQLAANDIVKKTVEGESALT